MIKFLFFAQLTDETGCDSLELEFSEGKCVSDYLGDMASKIPAKVIAGLKTDVAISINQQFASIDDELNDGDIVGLLPPFSGG